MIPRLFGWLGFLLVVGVLFGTGAVTFSGVWNVLKDASFLAFLTTIIGVFLAVYVEGRIERRRETADKRDRVRQWACLIRNGAEVAAQHVEQMLDVEFSQGRIPTFKPDRFVATMLDPRSVRDLLDERDVVNAHRSAVFEMEHLGRKLDVLFQIHVQRLMVANDTQKQLLDKVTGVEMRNTMEIAQGARAELRTLVTKCDDVLARVK